MALAPLPQGAEHGQDVLPGANARIQPEEVARAIAETVENPRPPLRVPVGPDAIRQLAARRASPDDRPFSFLSA